MLAGFGLFVSAIFANTDNYLMFFSLSSFAMVIGGTVMAAMLAYEGKLVLRAFSGLAKVIFPLGVTDKSLVQDAQLIMDWSKVVQREGLLNLERHVDKTAIKDDFLNDAVMFLTSGYKGPALRRMLHNHMSSRYEREIVVSNILQTMANFAPGFGMIGTLVGLIIMLDNLNGDTTLLGIGLAVALITTLYGVLFANLLLKPASLKVKHQQEILLHRRKILTEGFVYLAEGENALAIQDMINSYLDPSARFHKEDQ